MPVLLPRRRIWRMAIYFVCLCLVGVAADLIVVQLDNEIQPGYETTRIIAPTLPDGSVDYLKAVENDYASGVTEENNAAPLIIQALGRIALSWDEPPDGITDRLGMPHLPETGDYFVAYDDYCHDHSISAGTTEIDPDSPLTWPPTVSASINDWIKANQKPLDLMVRATGRSRFYIPWDAGYRPEMLESILLPYLNPMRGAAHALLIRAVVRLEAGDVAGFQDDVLSVHRLARLVDQTPTLVDLLVAMGPIETSACNVDRLAAASGKLSADQEKELADQLQSLRDLRPYVQNVDRGERYFGLDIVQLIAHAPLDQRTRVINTMLGSASELKVRLWPIRCEAAMKELNNYYDGLVVAALQPTYSRRIDAMRLWSDRVAQMRAHNPYLIALTPDWPVCWLMPTLDRLETRATSAKMQRRITVIALLLAAYKADHGVYPDNLNSLSVDTTDLFNDQPLVYAAQPNGYELHTSTPDMFNDAKVGADFKAIFPPLH